MPERSATTVTIAKLAGCCLLASVVVAALMFPVAGGIGLMSNRASDVVAQRFRPAPRWRGPGGHDHGRRQGQHRSPGCTPAPVRGAQRQDRQHDEAGHRLDRGQAVRRAQRRGLEGHADGLAGYASGDADTRGGSTIEQQYVKNYQLLVIAQSDAEKRAAIETTPARKLREIRMALTLDKTFTKPEILTRYLNLVSFGNNAFGVQDAAQTYFGVNASELNWQQAALLAGLVQSTSALNPYINPDGALAPPKPGAGHHDREPPQRGRRTARCQGEPLGVLPQPKELPRGCIAAGDRAFFCDYVLDYLARAGISKEQVARGGYLIRTIWIPRCRSRSSTRSTPSPAPTLDGIASVMSVIKPGKDAHQVVAMASNRTYGLNTDAGETMQPQPFSLVGDGAGSIFKIFTTAAALEMGMGINAKLEVPGRFQAKGMGSGGAKGCPKEHVVRASTPATIADR